MKISTNTNGYTLDDIHFKIGSKIHTKHFVYAKKIFQKNYYASKFAFLLAQDIYSDIIEPNMSINCNYTIIGYGFYSELLVSRLNDFLNIMLSNNDNISSRVNHMVIEDEDNVRFTKFFQEFDEKRLDSKLQEKLILVVPISSTLTTCLKIENEFYCSLDKFKEEEGLSEDFINLFEVMQPFFTVVIAGHKSIEDSTEKDKDGYLKYTEDTIVSNFWVKVNPSEKIIITMTREKNEPKQNRYYLYIATEWNDPIDCPYCFPKEELLSEKPLFVSDKTSVTPSLILGTPQWSFKKNRSELSFQLDETCNHDTTKPVITANTLFTVHYKGSGKHFQYYLHYPSIFRENFKQIQKWLCEIKKSLYKHSSVATTSNILLITPDKSKNGSFVHTVNKFIFEDQANIIKLDPDADYFINFDVFFNKEVEAADFIFYVDNIMVSGQTFQKVYDVLKTQQKNAKGICGIFTLINKMDYESYERVKRKLLDETYNSLYSGSEKSNTDYPKSTPHEQDYIFSLMDINVPAILSADYFCPLCMEEKIIKHLTEISSLDVIRDYFRYRELPCYKLVQKDDLTGGHYIGAYRGFDNGLLTFMISHYLFDMFSDESCKSNLYFNNPQTDKPFSGFIDDFRKFLNKDRHVELENIDDIDFKISIIKALASHVLIRHKNIKITLFHWILFELRSTLHDVINNAILETSQKHPEPTDFFKFFQIFNYLRLLIKYASILECSYLLSKEFIDGINNLLNNETFRCWQNWHEQNKSSSIKNYLNKALNGNENNDLLSYRQKSDQLRKQQYAIEHLWYALYNFKIFCAAHIKRSLVTNEQKSVRFETNLSELFIKFKNAKKRTLFLELLLLENTGIIEKLLTVTDKIQITKHNKDDIDNNINVVNKLIYPDRSYDIRLKNFKEFNSAGKSSFIQIPQKKEKKSSVEAMLLLKHFLTHSSEGNNIKWSFEKNIEYILYLLCKIIGINTNNGGAFLVYKYRDTDETPNVTVISSIGDRSIVDNWDKKLFSCFEKTFAYKMLQGYKVTRTRRKQNNMNLHGRVFHLIRQKGSGIADMSIVNNMMK